MFKYPKNSNPLQDALKAVPVRWSCWAGRVTRNGGPLMSDGHILVQQDKCDPKRYQKLADFEHALRRSTVAPNKVAKLYRDLVHKAVDKPSAQLEAIIERPNYKGGDNTANPDRVAVFKLARGKRIVINAYKLRTLMLVCPFDQLAPTGGVEAPLVARRNGEPVGLVSPMRADVLETLNVGAGE